MPVLIGFSLGFLPWFLVRAVLLGIHTVDRNQRAVTAKFGRAERMPGGKATLDDPIATEVPELPGCSAQGSIRPANSSIQSPNQKGRRLMFA